METATHSLLFRSLVPGKPPKQCFRRSSPRVLAASRRDSDGWMFGSRLVDQNMIILRKRIQEMKMMESDYRPPSHWMDWEKKYYTSYNWDIYEGMARLQEFLMNTRPSVALGMLMLFSLSVPTSFFVLMFKLIEVGSGIIGH